MLMTSLFAAVVAASGSASAADSGDMTKGSMPPPAPQSAMPDRDHAGGGMEGHGMQGGTMPGMNGMGMGGMMGNGMMGGMGGMMGMMNGCSTMMGGGMTTPRLPPGNEKLQLKMQAEIMQKTAEILSKYADQIGDGK